MTIPGVGPIVSTAITALVPAAEGFAAGRNFAAWLGLTPLQKSTGGKQKLGADSKRGERTIRRLLIIGASTVVQQASRRGHPRGRGLRRCWLANRKCRSPSLWPTRWHVSSGLCWKGPPVLRRTCRLDGKGFPGRSDKCTDRRVFLALSR